jgi:hypothetical protein
MEFYHVTVDFMTTSYVLNIELSDIFNTMYFFQEFSIGFFYTYNDTKRKEAIN